MAYLALYRKWRPRTFTEIVGQTHISIPLERAIEQDRLSHAYLFSGPRGTGKTSMAKILAKAVNCLDPQGANPCNTCKSCLEINSGSSLDVYEIDAASNRGIEEIRALKESVRTLPSAGRKKVYIIDEVHMLTKEAFNALLKTLEEPPAHVLFILATTEPEKIPLTILSRCQRYEFHRISSADIKKQLLRIAKESSLPLTENAADIIAVRADGGLRDALSLLDQCSSASETGTLDAESVYHLLGLTGKDRILELSHHIFNGKSADTLSLFYSILQDGKEPASILRDLLDHFRNLMICKVMPDAPELSQYGNKVDTLRSDASRLSAPYMDALFDDLHHALSETRRSSSPRLNAEMGLLRLCRIKGSKSLDSLAERIEQLERKLEQLQKEGISSIPPSREQRKSSSPLPPPSPIPAFTSPVEISSAPPDSAPINESRMPPSASVTPLPVSVPSVPPAPVPSVPANANTSMKKRGSELIDPSTYSALWQKVLNYFMSIRRIDVLTCLRKSTLIYCTHTRAVVSAPQLFLVSAGNNKSYQKVAAEAFAKITGSPIELHTVLKGSEEEASALALLQSSPAASSPAIPPRRNDYRPISGSQISDTDRNNPSLQEALKIMADCDIYEKTES